MMAEHKAADSAILLAGAPSGNAALYHRIRFLAGDAAAYIQFPAADGGAATSLLIMRDIEVARARETARADEVQPPAAFAPAAGLASDRETATAQAAAECLRRRGIKLVKTDRTLPFSFAHEVIQAGITLEYAAELGVSERRHKDAWEIEQLREAQQATEQTVAWACRLIGGARAGADGSLQHEGEPLTAERVTAMIDIRLLQQGYENPFCIVAPGKCGGDCHERGSGPIRTGEAVIVDIFPRNKRSRYWGDCTRTVVHGEIPEQIQQMHKAVLQAKTAAIAATRVGATGEEVYRATMQVIERHGYGRGLPAEDSPVGFCSMQHGTGHGVGLEVHEPPLLDEGGPPLVDGDVVTIEPGLYAPGLGGVRVEDMLVVRPNGCKNLTTIPEGLTWS